MSNYPSSAVASKSSRSSGRPIYENEETKRDEKQFKSLFEKAFPDYLLRKNSIQYRLDFSVFDKRRETVVAMLELRCRHYTIKKIQEFGGLKISLLKWRTALDYWENLGIPVRFFFRFLDTPEGEYYRLDANRENHDQCRIDFMTMNSRNDWQDCEPCLLIPVEILDKKKLLFS